MMIWELCMPEAGSGGDGTRGPQDLQPFCTVAETSPDPVKASNNLSVLRASKTLYAEVVRELHRNRVLTICFNGESHALDSSFPAMVHATIGGICRLRKFHVTEFYKFSSVRFNIRLPNEDYLRRSLRDFVRDLQDFTRRFQTGPEGKSHDSESRFQKVDIVIYCSSYMPNHPSRKIYLGDIFQVLVPFMMIPYVEDASIEVEFPLPSNQDLLPMLKRIVIREMKAGSQQERGKAWLIEEVYRDSRELT